MTDASDTIRPMTRSRRPIDLDDETERLSPAGDDAQWWLLVVEGGRSIAHRLARGRPLIIGRSEECDVRIDHPSISRRHAQLLVGPPVCLQDLGSANGTRVGGQPIEPRMLTPVDPGQAIELAPWSPSCTGRRCCRAAPPARPRGTTGIARAPRRAGPRSSAIRRWRR